jgi:environmental stress-induced protein Ves
MQGDQILLLSSELSKDVQTDGLTCIPFRGNTRTHASQTQADPSNVGLRFDVVQTSSFVAS